MSTIGSSPRNLNSRNEYTIGWICALAIESAAALAMLEEIHEKPKDFKQPGTDNNVYSWGRISGHNIVIAALPSGEYGTASAANVATTMLSSFPEIRFGLLVGIGAAIPREGKNVRLGDIAVSRPDGKSGGVVQYDLGKARQDGQFLRTGSLNSPPLLLRNAVTNIQTKHIMNPSRIPEYHKDMLNRFPRMRESRSGIQSYVYQGQENDCLFKDTYNHVGGDNCTKCDKNMLVRRERRSEEPEIHYGVVASGNTLVKDAKTRGILLKHSEEDCICFEMEAAGLMNQFPCLVIRGLCDYADSHKNDQWQCYAAATAACYARELLQYVPVREVGSIPTANETMNQNPTMGSNNPSFNNQPMPERPSVPPQGVGGTIPPSGAGSSNSPKQPGTNGPPIGDGNSVPRTEDNNTMRTDAIYDGRWQHQWRSIWAGRHIQEINPNFASTQRISEIQLVMFTHTTWASCIVEVDIFYAPGRLQGVPEMSTTICTDGSGASAPVSSPFYQQVDTQTIIAGQPYKGYEHWNRVAYFQPAVAKSTAFTFLGRRVMGCPGKSEEGGMNLAPLNASDYRWRLKDLNLVLKPGHRIYAVIRVYSVWDMFAFRALVNISMYP
ncbi:hypothetical protein AJ79_09289 [Helicocarpus griseus UAMH5409]|uniref:Nucleoside phosphorylase domain-containing protein n=1 Tax=Helicocarpus griseus UAMH5409 TaxID=1447875 RepID=A0A2B7WKS9_9EURO|nr:hypothetical protein AJ79_09289 [Helicocarpus griseus UAMH5409]